MHAGLEHLPRLSVIDGQRASHRSRQCTPVLVPGYLCFQHAASQSLWDASSTLGAAGSVVWLGRNRNAAAGAYGAPEAHHIGLGLILLHVALALARCRRRAELAHAPVDEQPKVVSLATQVAQDSKELRAAQARPSAARADRRARHKAVALRQQASHS